ncbi:MAG: hypothetical protein GY918_05925, partial [Gammaproteobacteria bacterium]|nr:hypothetical protein [Gammaproteobacteria bacterium]
MALTKVTSGVRTLGTGEVGATEIASSLDLSAKTVTLPAASVTAHVTAYDDAGLRNDISTLALHSAIADNKAAYNLSNAFIDQFEDDTGVDVETTCSRNAAEFMASQVFGSIVKQTLSDSNHGKVGLGGGPHSGCYDGNLTNTYCFYSSAPNNWDNFYYWYDFGASSNFELSYLRWHQYFTQAGFKDWKLSTSTGDEASGTFTDQTGTPSESSSAVTGGYRAANTNHVWNRVTYDTPIRVRTLRVGFNNYQTTGNSNAGFSELEIYGRTATNNATGNFTSATQTATATVSTMGAVILYKNNAGTATLNTDLVLQLSSDG